MSNKAKSKHAGKGMAPKIGYNYKNWYANYDSIFKKKQKMKSDTNK